MTAPSARFDDAMVAGLDDGARQWTPFFSCEVTALAPAGGDGS